MASSTSEAVVGTCDEMCPLRERMEREEKGELDGLEDIKVWGEMLATADKFNFSRIPHLYQRRTTARKAVKKFRRSAAGANLALPDKIRTPQTLLQTADYLISVVLRRGMNLERLTLSQEDTEIFGYFYGFLSNRFKAIRQDFVIQQSVSMEYVKCLELQTRFELFALFYFQEDRKIQYPFYRKLCLEQLNICLSKLLLLYGALRRENLTCPNESEFTACSLLMQIETSSLNSFLLGMPTEVLKSEEVQNAIKLVKLARRGDFVMFFMVLNSIPFSCQCSVVPYLPKLMAISLRFMNKSYTKRETMELDYLSLIFGSLPVDQVNSLCLGCKVGVEVSDANRSVARFGSKDFSSSKITELRPWDKSSVCWFPSRVNLDMGFVVETSLKKGIKV